MAKGLRFGVLAVAFCQAGCSVSAARSLMPTDPKFAAAVEATTKYAARYYHLKPEQCGAAFGFRFGIQQQGDRLIVSMKPPKPRTDAIRVSLRRSDLTLIEAQHFTS